MVAKMLEMVHSKNDSSEGTALLEAEVCRGYYIWSTLKQFAPISTIAIYGFGQIAYPSALHKFESLANAKMDAGLKTNLCRYFKDIDINPDVKK